MSESKLDKALTDLTEIQKQAVEWVDGGLLILAGPGSGKTQVLTARIGNILSKNKDHTFRVLALTFTNKAADEMMERVMNFVPGMEERVLISTFHGFCGQVLRQHGIHIGVKSDFTIYSLDSDRKQLLEDAIARANSAGQDLDTNDLNVLPIIDRLKAKLFTPETALPVLAKFPDKEKIVELYKLYENELQLNNALDYNSLILETHKLFSTFPTVAARYRRSYPFWMVDEFQDTTDAQYKLLHAMAGNEFKNLVAVADDDQIIYQWNGASFKQIQRFKADFKAELIQLPTNHRCPPAIVEAANRLVVYNLERTENKSPLVAAKQDFIYPSSEHIQLRVFETDEDEAAGIAKEISDNQANWGKTAVLGRTKKLLESVHDQLSKCRVNSTIVQRRDDFQSPELRWAAACLRQVCRPLDKRNLTTLIEAFNRLSGSTLTAPQILALSEASGHSYLLSWFKNIDVSTLNNTNSLLVHKAVSEILENPNLTKKVINKLISDISESLDTTIEGDSDLLEDISAWTYLVREIGRHIGNEAPLEEFMQEMQLRSKEPPPKINTVSLMTVHASKGREFDIVYIVGLAEDIMPSFQSKQKGPASPEMEEERRGCFVAITRTKECLILSRANSYRGWKKSPSRFMVEMGFIN